MFQYKICSILIIMYNFNFSMDITTPLGGKIESCLIVSRTQAEIVMALKVV
jgi:hypothetical protein